MSRIGKLPIKVPSGVTVTIGDQEVTVKGPKGQLSQARVPNIGMSLDDSTVTFTRADETKPVRASHGLMRALVNNMVVGVTKGFEKKLEIVGVGYRAEVKGKNLVMHLGYSHPIEFPIPAGVQVAVDKSTISVAGIDKQQVGQIAANIRAFRAPDHYKGKGVRYEDERVRIKAGKSA